MTIELPFADILSEAISLDFERRGLQLHIRQEGAFEAAVARAENLLRYDATNDPLTLAVAIGFSLFKIRHPLADGNKRAGFNAIRLTLRLNGWDLDLADDPFDQDLPSSLAYLIAGAAAGSLSEEELIECLRPRLKAFNSL